MQKIYKPELNFLSPAEVNRNGMVEEIRKELDAIRVGFSAKSDKGVSKDVPDRIIVTSMRKILIENQRVPILLQTVPNFKMPVLKGRELKSEDDKLVCLLPPYMTGKGEDWIPIKQWFEQEIAYYYKTKDDLPYAIPVNTFSAISNKLRGEDKTKFNSLMVRQQLTIDGISEDCYAVKNPDSDEDIKALFSLFKQAGYYDLTLYDFIKHLSDKRGAHIDNAISPLILVVNGDPQNTYTAIEFLAFQLMYAITQQVSELKDYCAGLGDLLHRFDEQV